MKRSPASSKGSEPGFVAGERFGRRFGEVGEDGVDLTRGQLTGAERGGGDGELAEPLAA